MAVILERLVRRSDPGNEADMRSLPRSNSNQSAIDRLAAYENEACAPNDGCEECQASEKFAGMDFHYCPYCGRNLQGVHNERENL